MKRLAIIACITGLSVFSACRPDVTAPTMPALPDLLHVEVPDHFPPFTQPDGNMLTKDRVALGKALFFDSRLSSDGMVSCASCHLPDAAFADPLQVSLGAHGREGFRNAPSLANVAFHPFLFMDGGVPTLELQVLAPFDDPTEFDFPITEAAELLASDPEIRALSLRAYGRIPDPFVITRSLAAFERTLISADSPYDRYLSGDASALNASALEGMSLFFSESVGCGNCHSGPLLTNFSFENIGLYSQYTDEGRQRVTALAEDNGKFKVPSLRNVAVTAPYMHDGSLLHLDAVIEHFNAGGADHPLKHPAVRPLNLEDQEKEALKAFLNALTDETFINNTEHRR